MLASEAGNHGIDIPETLNIPSIMHSISWMKKLRLMMIAANFDSQKFFKTDPADSDKKLTDYNNYRE